MNDSLKVSLAMLEKLTRWEGFSPNAYADTVGKPTIGYGHLIKSWETFPSRITEAAARALLLKDVEVAEDAVKQRVKVILTQGQFDALVSFTFNLGAGNLAKSTLLRKLNSGDVIGAAGEFKRWNKAGDHVLEGLTDRRNGERLFFIGASS